MNRSGVVATGTESGDIALYDAGTLGCVLHGESRRGVRATRARACACSYVRAVRTNGAGGGDDVDVYVEPPSAVNQARGRTMLLPRHVRGVMRGAPQATAVAFLGRNVVAAGHTDGVVRAYHIDTLEFAKVRRTRARVASARAAEACARVKSCPVTPCVGQEYSGGHGPRGGPAPAPAARPTASADALRVCSSCARVARAAGVR